MNLTHNLIKNIPELNTPERIIKEWESLSEPPKLPEIENTVFSNPNKPPSFEEFQSVVFELYSKLDHFLEVKNTDDCLEVSIAANQIQDVIFNFLIFYSNIPNIPFIKDDDINNSSILFRMHKTSSECLGFLSKFTTHVELLANPALPTPGYWNLLSQLNSDVFASLTSYMEELNKLRTKYSMSKIDEAIILIKTGGDPTKDSKGLPKPDFDSISKDDIIPEQKEYDEMMNSLDLFGQFLDELKETIAVNELFERQEVDIFITNFTKVKSVMDVIYNDMRVHFSELNRDALPFYTKLSPIDLRELEMVTDELDKKLSSVNQGYKKDVVIADGKNFISNVKKLSEIYKQPYFEAPPSRSGTPRPSLSPKAMTFKSNPAWAPKNLSNYNNYESYSALPSPSHHNSSKTVDDDDVTLVSRSHSASSSPKNYHSTNDVNSSALKSIMNGPLTSPIHSQLHGGTTKYNIDNNSTNSWNQPKITPSNKKKRRTSQRVANLLSRIEQNHLSDMQQQQQQQQNLQFHNQNIQQSTNRFNTQIPNVTNQNPSFSQSTSQYQQPTQNQIDLNTIPPS